MPHHSAKAESDISLPEEPSDRDDIALVFAKRAEALHELGHYQVSLKSSKFELS